MIQDAEGFIYAVAVNGVTGKAGSYRDDLDHHLAQLHEIASIPVLTGFGVSSMEDVHPVSYTHLDVYKRQLMCRPEQESFMIRSLKMNTKKPSIRQNR